MQHGQRKAIRRGRLRFDELSQNVAGELILLDGLASFAEKRKESPLLQMSFGSLFLIVSLIRELLVQSGEFVDGLRERFLSLAQIAKMLLNGGDFAKCFSQ